ncbi:MAG: DNA polymerase I [Alphaproteobacteria bacterium]|jgi:DNA polymerase I|nr:DNA polymerase I [Alphaproteobacteria bacterium]MBT4085641.1 DNA polymerase I [Alphaproteobacteria bacterium]MBT4544488.1 DNA polymerase I [Alphaproteobacteria bacterium]MBT7746263.1 DNA polymerase I [Alphaproteobacteria bacterium]
MAKAEGGRKGRVYLVDGSGYIFRAYHALPPLTRKSDGTPVGAVSGFCNMLNKLVDDITAEDGTGHMAVIFDTARKTFRNEFYAEYKAHRPPAPEDLVPQFPLFREATQAFNVATWEMDGFEADDLIATYTRMAVEDGYEVVIVSSDKDLMQLVGEGVTMLDPMKQRRIGPDEVFEKFGVGPELVIDVQALAGDSADNVPGVPGIGVKTAALLINEYGDLDAVLARASEIKQNKRRENLIEFADQARISRDLVTLKQDVPVEDGIDAMELKAPDPEALFTFLAVMEFTKLAQRLKSRFGDVEIDLPEIATATTTGDTPDAEKAPAPADSSYVAVQTTGDLEDWIARAYKTGYVAVDTETTGLDAMQVDLVGISLSVTAGEACYIPLAHTVSGGGAAQGSFDLGEPTEDTAEAPDQIPMKQALDLLRPLLADPSVLKIGQNIKYDAHILARHDVIVQPIDDTMLLSFVLDAGSHGHGMDTLSKLHLDITPVPFKEVVGTGKNQLTFDQVPLEEAVRYAAEDADITLRLHQALKPRLAKDRMVTVYETLERPLSPVLLQMERAGIKVNASALAGLSADFAKQMVDLEREIHSLAGREFNVASPKQLGEILFGEMELPGGKKSSKTGAWSTDADVLDNLAAEGHELPVKVLAWRHFAKLKSTYTDALQESINPDTGRVHTSYAMAGAATGRLASKDPNLQNIPIRTEEGRKIREAFVAKEGHKLLAADYSQIELRLLAHVADMDSLRQAFRDGVDIHALTASQVFGIPVEDIDGETRRRAKAINFGIVYGISPFGLARQLGIGQRDAKAYIETYFEQYPGIRAYMEDTKAFCREHGYVETIFGRRCHLEGINDKNGAKRAFNERAAINAPLQGAAADVIKRAMVRVPDALNTANLNATMMLQVHDELLFEVPEAEIEKTTKVVKQVMESAAHLSVPLIVDCGVGDNWGEAH